MNASRQETGIASLVCSFLCNALKQDISIFLIDGEEKKTKFGISSVVGLSSKSTVMLNNIQSVSRLVRGT